MHAWHFYLKAIVNKNSKMTHDMSGGFSEPSRREMANFMSASCRTTSALKKNMTRFLRLDQTRKISWIELKMMRSMDFSVLTGMTKILSTSLGNHRAKASISD